MFKDRVIVEENGSCFQTEIIAVPQIGDVFIACFRHIWQLTVTQLKLCYSERLTHQRRIRLVFHRLC